MLTTECIKQIRDLISTLRELVCDNRVLYKSIDDTYEEAIVDVIKMIPSDSLNTLALSLIFANSLLGNIKAGNIIADIHGSILGEFADNYTISINMFNIAVDSVKNSSMQRTDKARVMNVIQKMKPVLDAATYVVHYPMRTIKTMDKLTKSQIDLLN